MRKMLLVSAALLLAVTSAQAAFVVSLTAGGLSEVAPGTYTVDVMYTATDADGFWGGQFALAQPLPADWSVSGLTFNNAEFDVAFNMGTTPLDLMVNSQAVAPFFNTTKRLVSFTLVAPSAGVLALNPETVVVANQDFEDITNATLAPLVVTPEPATALLLIGALPFLRRRRA